MKKARLHPCHLATLLVSIQLGALALGQISPVAKPGKDAGPRLGPITKLEITITNRAQADQLATQGFDVDSVVGNRVLLYADADELENLSRQGWQMIILKE